MRSHFVVCLSALSQFSSGGLSFVGIDWKEALSAVGGVQYVEKDMNGEHPIGF